MIMEQKLFAGDTPEKRKQMLEDNCEQIEELEYSKEFTEEEVQELKENLANHSIQLNKLEQEYDEVKKDFQEKMKPLKETIKRTIEYIPSQQRLVSEQVYKFMDWNEKQVGYYNKDGILVKQRPMFQSEKQASIFTLNSKTGTDE